MLLPFAGALLAEAGAPPAAAAIALGDSQYARRAEKARAGVAAPEPIEAAIAAYRRALALDPLSYEARLRMLRALFFRGGFCIIDPAAQIKLFEEAKSLAEDTVRNLERGVPSNRGQVGSSHGAARLEALRRIPHAAEIYLWSAISWGQWAATHKIAAAWQGAASRIRDLSQTGIDLKPGAEQGSGYVILGRLHIEAPHIPLLTGWVSRQKGIASLRQALAIAPQNTPARYFLAAALLEVDPSRSKEARELLAGLAATPPRPEYPVEDAHYAEAAKRRLAALR